MTNTLITPEIRRVVHQANKYIRKKKYRCFVPGCQRTAIKCHAIPRASLIEALADNGHVYTRSQSFTDIFRMSTPHDPVEIVETGVNEASVFKGLCDRHDTEAFATIERPIEQHGEMPFTALHFRALLLEQDRKRKVFDYYTKVVQLLGTATINSPWKDFLPEAKLGLDIADLALLGFMESAPELGSGATDYYCFAFSKNVEVSCCGLFNHLGLMPDSVIAYNLISFADFSVIALTSFHDQHKTLDSFVLSYSLPGPDGLERLLNDIAFLKGEEPILSVRLWQSLDEATKLELRKSLVHPNYRLVDAPPKIIKLTAKDVMTTVPPEARKKMLLPTRRPPPQDMPEM